MRKNTDWDGVNLVAWGFVTEPPQAAMWAPFRLQYLKWLKHHPPKILSLLFSCT